MRIKVRLSFTEIEYTIKGHPELTGYANRPYFFERELIVKDSVANKEYKLQHPNILYHNIYLLPVIVIYSILFFSAFGILGDFVWLAEYFMLLCMAVILVFYIFLRDRLDYYVDNINSGKATEAFCFSPRKHFFWIENDEYEVSKHNNLTHSIMKNGVQIAVLFDKDRGALAWSSEGDFELLYSKQMNGKEHILLLLFLGIDAKRRSKANWWNRNIDWRIGKVIFDKNAERANWRPEEEA